MGKKIYLYGISGVYNYGCEAMVRNISSIIMDNYPDNTVIYKTYNYSEDVAALKGCDSVIVEPVEYQPHNFFEKGIRFTKRILKIAKPQDYLSINLNWTLDCDALVIIGGDIFDLTPSQRSAKTYRNERIDVSKVVKSHGGKVYLWGISVGDFDCNPNAKKVLLEYFNNTVDEAVIRDESSYQYLKKNGVKNIKLCSDPAFISRTIQVNESEQNKKRLGINLSPLANRYLKVAKSGEEWVEFWADFIIKAVKQLNYKEVYLISHVVNPNNKKDDDYSYLRDICCLLDAADITYSLVPPELGFLGVKKYIVKCDMILAARMHCAVNALTCGVPTVFLSYSPKSYGMSMHVYGNMDMVIDMNDIVMDSDAAITKISRIKQKNDIIKGYLNEKNKELCADAKSAVNYIYISRCGK